MVSVPSALKEVEEEENRKIVRERWLQYSAQNEKYEQKSLDLTMRYQGVILMEG